MRPTKITILSLILVFAFFQTGCFINSKIAGLGEDSSSKKDGSVTPDFLFPPSLSIIEGSSENLTFKMENPSESDISFLYEIVSDTAVAGVNFVYASGLFTLNKTSPEKTISLSTFDTQLSEGQNKRFQVVWKRQDGSGGSSIVGTSEISLVSKPDLSALELTSFTKTAPKILFDAGSYLLYTSTSVATGTELWRTDGTAPGTFSLGDFCPGECSTDFYNFGKMGGQVYFGMQVPGSKPFIWKTDGTVAGTQVAITGNDLAAAAGVAAGTMEIYYMYGPEGQFFGANLFTIRGTKLIIPGRDSSFRLFSSDGTGAGCMYLTNLAWTSVIYYANTSNYTLINDGGIRSTDGTFAGTVSVAAWTNSIPGVISVFNDIAYTTYSPTFGLYRPYRTDGTAPGSAMLANATVSGNGLFFGPQLAAGHAFMYNTTYPTSTDIWAVPSSGNNANLIMTIPTWMASPIIFGNVNSKGIIIKHPLASTFGGAVDTLGALYVSNGTAGGTTKVTDLAIPSGNTYSYSRLFATINNKLLFSVESSNTEYPQLWLSDGTVGGTTTANSFFAANGLTLVRPLKMMGNEFLFTAYHASYGFELWKTDLTLAGTVLFFDFNAGSTSTKLEFMFEGIGGVWLSKTESNGLSAKMVKVKSIGDSSEINDVILPNGNTFALNAGSTTQDLGDPNILLDTNHFYFFGADNSNLFNLFKGHPGTGTREKIMTLPTELRVVGKVGNKIYFHDTVNYDLTIVDTSTAVKTVINGVKINSSSDLTEFGGKVYFIGTSSANGSEPWVTDGTAAGTFLLADIVAGPTSSTVNKILVLNPTTLLLFASDAVHKSNGTPGNIQLVSSITYSGINSYRIFKLGTKVVFNASTVSNGYELWVTDGTTPGTTLLQDIDPGVGNGVNWVNQMYELNGRVLFFGSTAGTGTELWATDGTTIGILRDIYAGGLSSFTAAEGFAAYNKFYFMAKDSANNMELWVTDGTSVGTTLVKDICSGACGSELIAFREFKNKMYFWQKVTNGGGSTYSVLWSTDGTEAGTTQVADIRPNVISNNNINRPVSTDRYLYFQVIPSSLATTISLLWRSNGTNAEIIPNNNGFSPTNFTPFGNFLLFVQSYPDAIAKIAVTK